MTIVRKDKMLAGYNGNLQSVIVHDSTGAPVEVTNGVLVVIEGLMDNQREVKKAVLATEADKGKEVYLIHNAEVMADEKLLKSQFTIPAGKVARAYSLFNADIVTFTDDLFDGSVAVGDILSVKIDGKLAVDATPEDAKIAFVVIENSGSQLALNTQAFAIEVQR